MSTPEPHTAAWWRAREDEAFKKTFWRDLAASKAFREKQAAEFRCEPDTPEHFYYCERNADFFGRERL